MMRFKLQDSIYVRGCFYKTSCLTYGSLIKIPLVFEMFFKIEFVSSVLDFYEKMIGFLNARKQ